MQSVFKPRNIFNTKYLAIGLSFLAALAISIYLGLETKQETRALTTAKDSGGGCAKVVPPVQPDEVKVCTPDAPQGKAVGYAPVEPAAETPSVSMGYVAPDAGAKPYATSTPSHSSTSTTSQSSQYSMDPMDNHDHHGDEHHEHHEQPPPPKHDCQHHHPSQQPQPKPAPKPKPKMTPKPSNAEVPPPPPPPPAPVTANATAIANATVNINEPPPPPPPPAPVVVASSAPAPAKSEPQQPVGKSELPNTGPGDVFHLFLGTSAVGAIGHRLYARRRASRLDR